MLRRLLALLFAFLTVQTYSLCGAALAKGDADAVVTSADGDITVIAKDDVPVYFASGAKYDTETHQWKDRYNGKSIDLGIPGVAGRYGAQNVVADNTLVADSTGPGSGATTPSTSYFTWKNFIIITVLGLGIATSIAVPVALGAHHHHHHNFNNLTPQQQNQLAIYSFFHNQTLPIPKLILPPPPPVEHGGPPPPPPQNP